MIVNASSPDGRSTSEVIEPRHKRRLSWAIRVVGSTLKTALERDTSAQTLRLKKTAGDEQVYALGQMIMEQADPTANKRFTPWLVREYAAGRLILEDLGPANETLALFQRYASRLKPDQRDIQRYKNLAAAWDAVREFAERDEAQSNRAQKALERARAYAESRILRQDPDGFTVAVPLTEFAAKWWGRGTRWCTAAKKDNAFWTYHQKAPLLVITIPGVGKFQAWATTEDFHFMDASDAPVSKASFGVGWQRLQGLFIALALRNHEALDLISDDLITSELGYRCATKMPNDMHYSILPLIPEKHRTTATCLASVTKLGRSLMHVPQALRTYELCLAAVQQDGGALEFVPQPMRTIEIYETALRRMGMALRFIEKRERTRHLCRIAVETAAPALQFVPLKHITRELILAAPPNWIIPRYWIPEACFIGDPSSDSILVSRTLSPRERLRQIDNPSKMQYLEFVCMDGSLLLDVPAAKRDTQICLAAMKSAPYAYRAVPKRHRNEEVSLLAVQWAGNLLELVPSRYRTYSVCLEAVKRDGEALEFVPESHKTVDLCLTALRTRGKAIRFVPLELRTYELCAAAFTEDPSAVSWIPEPLLPQILSTSSQGSLMPLSWPLSLLDALERALHVAPDAVIRDPFWHGEENTKPSPSFTTVPSSVSSD